MAGLASVRKAAVRQWTSEHGTFQGTHSQSFSPTEQTADSPGKREASQDFKGRERPLQRRAMSQGPVEYMGRPGKLNVRAAAVAKVARKG